MREAQASTCEWQIVNPPDPAPSYNGLGGLAAIAANDVWVSGVAATTPELQIQHFNGSTWTQVPTRALPLSAVLVSMAAVSTDSVWAVGSNGDAAFISHWDGLSWSVVNNPAQNFNSDLYSVIATGKNDIWASGDISPAPFTHQALVEHYDGHKWQMYNLSGGTVLQAIAGTSNRDVWAGGSGTGLPGALVYHWDNHPNDVRSRAERYMGRRPNSRISRSKFCRAMEWPCLDLRELSAHELQFACSTCRRDLSERRRLVCWINAWQQLFDRFCRSV